MAAIPGLIATANLHLERIGSTALIRFNNPPVNALNNAIRAALNRLLDHLLSDDGVEGVMFAGAGGGFVAGADIGELRSGVQPPFLGDMLRRVEASPKPFVAALRGHAVGGGLEIALACHGRVAAPGTRLALPEVRLGLIAGAGGTQRLPRLIGLGPALDLLLTGRQVDVDEALALGLIDAIAEDVEAEALAMLQRRPRPRVRTSRTMDETALQRSAELVLKTPALADLPAAQAILKSASAAFDADVDGGFGLERALFLECLASPVARERIDRFSERRSLPK